MSGFTGYEMRFPIIKVKDKDNQEHVHIVGTNSHDTLHIDSKTKGIHYYNLQNGDGTHGDYEFVGKENGLDSNLQIEFVSFDELLEIYKSETLLTIEHEKQIKAFVEMLRIEKKQAETDGIFHT